MTKTLYLKQVLYFSFVEGRGAEEVCCFAAKIAKECAIRINSDTGQYLLQPCIVNFCNGFTTW